MEGEPSPAPSGRLPSDTPERAFVLGVWLVAAAMNLFYAARFAVNVPFWDDFCFVPVLAGEEAAGPGWLWQDRGGHRAPLPLAVALGLLRVSGGDFRSVAWANMILIDAGALLLILGIWRSRGCASFTDAVIPLSLLHWGPAISLIRAILMLEATRITLLCSALAFLPRTGEAPSRARRIGIAVVALLSTLTSTMGVIMGSMLALWNLSVFLGSRPDRLRERARLWRAEVLLSAAALVFAVVGVLGHSGTGVIASASRGWSAVLAVSLQALGQCVGPAGSLGWVEGGIRGGWPPVFSWGALLLCAATTWRLGTRVRKARTLLTLEGGLLLLLASVVATVVLIGIGRSQLRPDFGLQNHYGLYTAPLLGIAYLAWEPGNGRQLPRLVAAVLFTVSCSLFVYNAEVGWRKGSLRAERMANFVRDVRSGMGDEELAQMYTPLLWSRPDLLKEEFARMRRARIAPFDGLAR